MGEGDLLGGLVRGPILQHATREPIFALGSIEELAGHGCRLSAATWYRLLHGLERSGYPRWHKKPVCDRQRQAALAAAKTKVRERIRELGEGEPRARAGARGSPARSSLARGAALIERGATQGRGRAVRRCP